MPVKSSQNRSYKIQKVVYQIELPMVKHGTENLAARLGAFAEKYCRVIASGHAVSLTDNAMGQLAFQGHELLRELKLEVPEHRVMVHINTFHTPAHLHEILESCGGLGVRDLLIISGDGSVRLPKLRPADLGIGGEAVTSVELIAYIRKNFSGFFRLGAAFNQYEPPDHEHAKLIRKLEAGADFVITQPVIAPTAEIDELHRTLPVPLFLEAWMSPRIELLGECIGCQIASGSAFDPIEVLHRLETRYAGRSFYLALLNFAKQFELVVR